MHDTKKMPAVQQRLRGALVVSCQAAPGDPLESADTMRRMARAVVEAGAGGLRLNSAEHVAAIREDTDLPIIGIQKRTVNGRLFITPDFAAAEALAQAGASIIALDCTPHADSPFEPWPALIARIHRDLRLPVMADISTFEEAMAAAAAGADFVGTTLRGYTPSTAGRRSFDWDLLTELVKHADTPVIAEGHIATPQDARRALDLGAWCVVVGSAITRPGDITRSFLRAVGREARASATIGVDIGGTSVKAALVAASGEILHPVQTPTRASGGRDAIVAALVRTVEEVLEQARAAAITPGGIGIASAGVIETETGAVFAATDNLPRWTGFGLRAFAEERFHLPCRVVNDAQAAALAELHFGQGRGRRSLVALTVGTGVGGGIVINGRLVRGARGFGGALGHHLIRAGGRPCNCGRRGCLEAYVSTAALIGEYAALGGPAPAHITREGAGDAAALALHISRQASAGDTIATRAYDTVLGYLAEGIANIFNGVDPEVVILSGGLVTGHAEMLPRLRDEVIANLHFGSIREPRIELSAAGQYTGVQGAAALFLEEN